MTDTPDPAVPLSDDDGGDDEVHAPAELVELHEVIEWAAAVAVIEDGTP